MENRTAQQFLRKITIVSSFGGLMFGYDMGVINSALPFMVRTDQLALTPWQEGMAASILLLGAAVGSFLGGRLADQQGRRRVLSYLAGIAFFAALGCAAAPALKAFLLARAILGLAIGGGSVLVPAYLSEMAQTDSRAQMVTQNGLMLVVGQLLAFVVNAGWEMIWGNAGTVWRCMLAVAALPAAALWLGLLALPESPRWLVLQGRIREAMEVLRKARNGRQAIFEFNEIQDNLAAEAAERQQFGDLRHSRWGRRVLFTGIGIAICQQLSGVNAILYYSTQILMTAGFSTHAALIGNLANGGIAVCSTIYGIWLLGREGRRPLLLCGQVGTFTCLWLIGVFSWLIAETTMLPYVILTLTISFLFFQQGFLMPVTWLLLAEIFPQALRGIGMGTAVFCLWLTNFFVGLVFPMLLTAFGLTGTFFFFALLSLSGLGFAYRFVPETRGRSLEDIERDFRKFRS